MIWAVLIVVRQPKTTTQHLALKYAFRTIRLLLLTCSNRLLKWKNKQRRCYRQASQLRGPAGRPALPLAGEHREMVGQEDPASRTLARPPPCGI